MLWNINILHFNIALLRVAQSNVKNTILPSIEAKTWLIMAWSGFKRLKQSHKQIMYNILMVDMTFEMFAAISWWFYEVPPGLVCVGN